LAARSGTGHARQCRARRLSRYHLDAGRSVFPGTVRGAAAHASDEPGDRVARKQHGSPAAAADLFPCRFGNLLSGNMPPLSVAPAILQQVVKANRFAYGAFLNEIMMPRGEACWPWLG